MDPSDKQNRTPSVGREGSLFMHGMRCDVGASLSGPCNPTLRKSPVMSRRGLRPRADLTWFSVRPTSTSDQWSVFYLGGGKRRRLHAQDLSSLFARKEKVTRDASESWRLEI